MGRTAQERMLSKQKVFFGTCKYCGADYQTAGTLKPYELKNGTIRTLCHDCALSNWEEIKKQPSILEFTSKDKKTNKRGFKKWIK